MTEDNIPKVSEDSTMDTTSSLSTTTVTTTTATKQRKKRKWDQPAESYISAGLAVHGGLPLGNMGSFAGVSAPGVAPFTSALFTNPVPATCASITQAFQAPSNQQTIATVFQKINLPKIQDELIAREIVINDAESTVRYKLTKRQTQEEIQRCTGAVVITRGKYRPPNALPDNEKPLYLHISAGSHLKETAERIIAVDHAAAMVEEMLKQGQSPNPTYTPLLSSVNILGQVSQPSSVCVFLGFETDPLLNIAARIRGPNDQYINHIMNETGATVVLRGQGSGNAEIVDGEDLQKPLHLFMSCNNPKSLENAKLLAENLLDTIASECGASRVSSSKIYKAVPPPPQLLAGTQSSEQLSSSAVNSASSALGSTLVTPASLSPPSGVNGATPQVLVSQPEGLLAYGQPPPNTVCYLQPSVCGTSYSGYGGIYPHATPLQQVALVLKQSPTPAMSVISPATSAGNSSANETASSSMDREIRPPQKRKFQELPVAASKAPAEPQQGFQIWSTMWKDYFLIEDFSRISQETYTILILQLNSLQRPEFVKPGSTREDISSRNSSSMPPPMKLVKPSSEGMPPPPPRTIPPPPSRTMLPPPSKLVSDERGTPKLINASSTPVPDTLIKLMEYGGDDDDDDDEKEESQGSNSKPITTPKPFWAP